MFHFARAFHHLLDIRCPSPSQQYGAQACNRSSVQPRPTIEAVALAMPLPLLLAEFEQGHDLGVGA
jgi:hypothetical protein